MASGILGQSSQHTVPDPRIADIPAVSSLSMPGPETKLEHSEQYQVSSCKYGSNHDRVLSPLLNRVTGVPHCRRALYGPQGDRASSG